MGAERGLLFGQWLRLVVFHGLGALIAAATVALAAVAVPPAVYGDFGVMVSIVQSASSIGFVWINQGILRVGREEHGASGHTGGTLRAGLALSALVALPAVAVWLAIAAARPGWLAAGAAPLMAAAFAALAAFQFLTAAAQARGRFDGFAGGQIIARLGLLAAVAVFFAADDPGPLVLLAGATLGWTLAALHTLRPALPLPVPPVPRWHLRARAIIHYGRWLPVASAAGMLSQWMGLWLVHRSLGAAEAGLLLWALGALALVGGALQPLGAALAPRLIDLRLADDRATLRHRLELLVAIGVLLASLAPLLIGLVLAACWLLLPAAYAPAAPLLATLFASLPALALSAVAIPLVSVFERFIGRLVAVIVAGAAAQFLLLALLVPGLGAEGAAQATAVTTALMAVANCVLARAARGGTDPLASLLLRTLAIGAVPIALALPLRHADAAQAAWIGAAMTLALVVASRALGLLSLLGDFAPQLAVLPDRPRRLALRALAWLAR